jgi:hypothetical protein
VLVSAADQQTPVFRSGTNLVQVDAIVTGPDGRPVLVLSVDDFALYDDGDRMPIRSVRLLGAASADLKGPFAPIRNRDDELRGGGCSARPRSPWRGDESPVSPCRGTSFPAPVCW